MPRGAFSKKGFAGGGLINHYFRLYFSQNLRGLIFIEKRKAALMDSFWVSVCRCAVFSINIKNLCFFYPAHSPVNYPPPMDYKNADWFLKSGGLLIVSPRRHGLRREGKNRFKKTEENILRFHAAPDCAMKPSV